jgi:hypothetical protein
MALKLLVTLPHYYRYDPKSQYGSGQASAENRLTALTGCVEALHRAFGANQMVLANHQGRPAYGTRTNASFKADALDIVICTTGDHHLLNDAPWINGLAHHVKTDAEPKRLGFACHRLLAEHAATYDVVAFMEDDLMIEDPMFLLKMMSFVREHGEDCVLQPNRFEIPRGRIIQKVYVDPPIPTGLVERLAPDLRKAPILTSNIFGETMRFEPASNPHSGCFFLTSAQYQRMCERPSYPDLDCAFVGPLESAASLGILRSFKIYKPVPENAGYLEILHAGNQYSNWLPPLEPERHSGDR